MPASAKGNQGNPLPIASVPGLARAMSPHIAILNALDEGAYIVDRQRQIVYWNSAAERITGFSEGEVVGHRCADGILNHVDAEGRHLCGSRCPLARAMRDGTEPTAEVFFHHKGGHRVATTVHGLPLLGTDGGIVGAIELFTDSVGKAELVDRITELESLAFLDKLTQLPNRRFLADALERGLCHASRSGTRLGVAMFDIDHFKQLNDTHGHAAGDEMLKIVGGTMTSVARRSDVFGRWGGEEFVAVLPNCARDSLRTPLERIRVLVAASWLDWKATRVSVTVSIGATLSTATDSPDSILERADNLLYQSKAGGRNRLSTDGDAVAA